MANLDSEYILNQEIYLFHFEVSVVEMNGGNVWVPWVNDAGDSGGEKGKLFPLG